MLNNYYYLDETKLFNKLHMKLNSVLKEYNSYQRNKPRLTHSTDYRSIEYKDAEITTHEQRIMDEIAYLKANIQHLRQMKSKYTIMKLITLIVFIVCPAAALTIWMSSTWYENIFFFFSLNLTFLVFPGTCIIIPIWMAINDHIKQRLLDTLRISPSTAANDCSND